MPDAEERRQDIALDRMHAEKQDERAQRCDPSRRKACEHDDKPGEQRPDGGDEGEQAGLDAPG